MTVYVTKVWGWEEPIGPLVFGDVGWLENAVSKLEQGDQVVLVGTLDDPTIPSEQGRLLGIMEPTKERVRSLDFPRSYKDRDYDDEGNYKWPHGLLNARAWTLIDRPFLHDIAPRKFSMDAVRGIVPLLPEEAALLAGLKRRPAEMARPTAIAEERIAQATGEARYTAPPPTTKRPGIMHMRRARAYTYMMELHGADSPSFKIGWAFDWKQREKTFNHASMPSLGGLRYQTALYHLWDTARLAFAMEQRLLRRFQLNRHAKNSEILTGVPRADIERVWLDDIMGSR